MESVDIEHYWTPADKFILNTIEKYGSLAMRTPRIQSPFDLVSWDDIKEDNITKFKLTKYVKDFYVDYLSKHTIMDHDDFFETIHGHFDAGDYSDVNKKKLPPAYKPIINEKTLMSHPPILGHWLDQSGFIGDEDRNNEKEKTRNEYMSLFKANKYNRPTTRNQLYPTFEGFVITTITKYKDLCNNCEFKFPQRKIFTLNETIDFNEYNGRFDKYKIDGIETIDESPLKFLLEGGGYRYKIVKKSDDKAHCSSYKFTEDNNYLNYKGNDYDVTLPIAPIIHILGEDTFTSNDVRQGFLYTDIRDAYHMNFDLTAQFNLEYDKNNCKYFSPDVYGDTESTLSSGGISKLASCMASDAHRIVSGSKIKKDVYGDKDDYSTKNIVKIRNYRNNEIKTKESGRLREDHRAIERKNVKEEPYWRSEENDPLLDDKLSEALSEIVKHDDKIWKRLPLYNENNFPIIGRNESCYESFSEYMKYNKVLSEIMYKSNNNYFWFMYGCLPTNNISYEDLYISTNYGSVLNKNISLTNLSNRDRKVVFDSPNSKVPPESAKDEFIRLNGLMIKFLGLIYSMNNTDIKGHEKIKTYYICNTSRNVKCSEVEYHLLDQPYRKITSSKYIKPEKTDQEKEIEERKRFTITPTDSDIFTARNIVSKLASKTPLGPLDFQFLKSSGLLKDSAMSWYDHLKPEFDKNKPEYKLLIDHLNENIKIITDFTMVPKKDLSDFTPPSDIVNLSNKLRFITQKEYDNLPRPRINSYDRDNLRSIIRIILDPSTTVVSKNMLKFLESTGIIDNITKDEKLIDELPYVKKGEGAKSSKHYMVDMNNPNYLKIQTELKNNSNFEDREQFDEKVTSFKRVTNVDGYKNDTGEPYTNEYPDAKKKGDGKGGGGNQQQKQQQNQQQGSKRGGGRRNRQRGGGGGGAGQ